MRKHVKQVYVLFILAFSAAAIGCDSATELAAPTAPSSETAVRVQSQSSTRAAIERVAWNEGLSGSTTATLSSGGGAVLLQDADNGAVIVGIVVPGGAIPGGQIDFSIALDCSGEYCVIDLRAERNGVEVDRFRKPVQLYINLDYLHFEEGSKLGVAQVVDGELVPVKGSRVVGNYLKATLNHFSLYAPFSGYLPISD